MPRGMMEHPHEGTERVSEENTSKPFKVGEPRIGNFAFCVDRLALRFKLRLTENELLTGAPFFFFPVSGSWSGGPISAMAMSSICSSSNSSCVRRTISYS